MEERSWFRRGAALVLHPLVDMTAVFDPDTGETHFISDLPSIVLQFIDDQPATLPALVERLDPSTQLDPDDYMHLFDALVFLEEAELIGSKSVDSR